MGEDIRQPAGAEDVRRVEEVVAELRRSSEGNAAAILDRLDRIIDLLGHIRPGR